MRIKVLLIHTSEPVRYKVVQFRPTNSEMKLFNLTRSYTKSDMDSAMLNYVDWKYGKTQDWLLGNPYVDAWELFPRCDGELSDVVKKACGLVEAAFADWYNAHHFVFEHAHVEVKIDTLIMSSLNKYIDYVKREGRERHDREVDFLATAKFDK